MYLKFSSFFPKAKIIVTYYEFLKAFSTEEDFIKFKNNLHYFCEIAQQSKISKLRFVVKGKKFKAYKTFYWKGDKK